MLDVKIIFLGIIFGGILAIVVQCAIINSKLTRLLDMAETNTHRIEVLAVDMAAWIKMIVEEK